MSLPNIYGTFTADSYKLDSSSSGALTSVGSSTYKVDGGGYVRAKDKFDSSLCSEIYGQSETVTPSSLACSYLIKY